MPADPLRLEQGLTFGEVAAQYELARPGYPEGCFDAIVEYGKLEAGDAALEIGAGTGKATMGFIARHIAVHALEPSPGMANVLRTKGVDAEESSFETWAGATEAFRLVYAAQAWHWVKGSDRYERVADALEPRGVVALFWNKAREWTGPLGAANDAAYDEHAPHLTSSVHKWELDRTLDELAAVERFRDVTQRRITWEESYSTDEYVTLLGTHSDHRILPDDQRARLHAAVGRVIDDFGGRVEVTYDVMCYLATRR